MTRQRDFRQQGSNIEPRRSGRPAHAAWAQMWAQRSRRLKAARAGSRDQGRAEENGGGGGRQEGGVVTQDRERGDLVVGVLRVELAEVASLVFQAGI